jgi:hypothetical protein
LDAYTAIQEGYRAENERQYVQKQEEWRKGVAQAAAKMRRSSLLPNQSPWETMRRTRWGK